MVISAARPLRSGGDKPYKTWLGTVLEPARVTAYTSTSPDSRAKAEAEIATLLTVKPCTGAAGMTLHTTVSGRVAADARLADLLLRAKPELCPAE